MTRPKRKPIPARVKGLVLARQKMACAECGETLGTDTEYDHRPALWMRSKTDDGKEYVPSQNDPDHIEALHKLCHLKRTVGRVPGASKTVSTKGSDANLRKKFNKLEGRTVRHKVKIPSRPFPKQKRKFQT